MSPNDAAVEGAACPLEPSSDKKAKREQAAPSTALASAHPIYFANPHQPVRKTLNKLPHWEQDGATYFFTWRLDDSIPGHLRRQWMEERTEWLLENPKPWSEETEREYHQRFSARVERWLDAGFGACVLRQPECRSIVEENLHCFDGQRCVHHAWVIMPNHVHTLTSLCPGWHMEQLLHTWKGYTSLRINRLLGQSGELWQEDYYNRLIRDGPHFDRVSRYIQQNPVKAKLSENEFALYVHPDRHRYSF